MTSWNWPVFWIDIAYIGLTTIRFYCSHQQSLSTCKSATYNVTIQNLTTKALLDTGANISVVSEKLFNSLPQKPKLSKVHKHKVTSARGNNLDPTGQCDLTFQLRNKQFMGRFIILQDLWRNLILGLNWQCNYRIGCNWNANGQHYITHNNKCLSTSTPSPKMEHTIENAGALSLPLRSICVIEVQAPTDMNTKHVYQ